MCVSVCVYMYLFTGLLTTPLFMIAKEENCSNIH